MSQSGVLNASGGPSGNVQTLTGNSGGAVHPTANNINVVGTGSLSVVGNPGTSTLTISSSASSGSLVLIQTQTATSQTTLNFTTGITSTYDTYFILSNFMLDSATAGTNLLCRLSTNGGVSYINTGYTPFASGLNVGPLDGAAFQLSFSGYLYNLTSGSHLVAAFMDTISTAGGSGGAGANYTVTSTVVNALQFVANDGTAFSGTISLYGVSQ